GNLFMPPNSKSPNTLDIDTNIPLPEELVKRAKALIPNLRSRTERCEEERRIPQENLDEMLAAGLFNTMKPKRYGGYEMGWETLCDLTLAIAEGCGSTGWIMGVCGGHPLMITNFDFDVQDEVWGTNPNTIISSAKMNSGAFKKTVGGYIGNGIMAISSGCHHADWFFAGGSDIEGSDRLLSTLIPLTDVTILDTWQVVGLAGTGSHDLEMKDVFVPDSRAFIGGERPPGTGLYDYGVYKVGHHALGPYTLASVVVGMAVGALDIFVADIKDKTSRHGAKIADFQSLQLRIAESAAELDAAKLLIRQNTREAMRFIGEGKPVPRDPHARLILEGSYASQLAGKAIERIFYAGGAGELFLDRHLQRIFRNVQAGRAQFGLNWDVQGTNYGRWVLGLEGEQGTTPLL
ncbi:MAG TPA: acyl-CoA dehydrogenase family protein, partial [Rhodospirillales bacterium]|nr:acyl-CoA dehydrogenase family protein [Rhodospirillales bacterium]